MVSAKQRSNSSQSGPLCSRFTCECPKLCDLAKQQRKFFGGFLRSEKTIFSFILSGCTFFSWLFFFSAATARDTVGATPAPTTSNPCNIWVVVDATVNIFLTKRLAELLLHKALKSGLSTQGLDLWMTFRGMHPQDALHSVKQESHGYAYSNGRADTHAKHRNTKQTPELKHIRLATTGHSHLQHLPPR